MKNPFKKNKRRAYITMPNKRSVKSKKRTLAREFKKKRTRNFKYIFSFLRFRTNRLVAKIAAFSLIIAFVCVSLVLIFFSEFFSVQHIKLTRKDFRVNAEEISFSMQEYRNQNIIFLSKRSIKKTLLKNHPSIKEIEIDKDFPRTLILQIGTYPISARWKVKVVKENLLEGGKAEKKEQELFVNQVGMATSGTSEDQNAFLIEEQEIRDNFFLESQLVVDQKILEQIHISRQLIEEALNTSIIKAKYYRNAREVHYITENETSIWLDFASPQKEQIEKLNHILAETDIFNNPLDHVDLRVYERVYWQASSND